MNSNKWGQDFKPKHNTERKTSSVCFCCMALLSDGLFLNTFWFKICLLTGLICSFFVCLTSSNISVHRIINLSYCLWTDDHYKYVKNKIHTVPLKLKSGTFCMLNYSKDDKISLGFYSFNLISNLQKSLWKHNVTDDLMVHCDGTHNSNFKCLSPDCLSEAVSPVRPSSSGCSSSSRMNETLLMSSMLPLH